MIRIENVCGKAIPICLIQILVGVIYDGIISSKTSFKGLAAMNEVTEYCPMLPRKCLTWQIAQAMTSSHVMRCLIWYCAI